MAIFPCREFAKHFNAAISPRIPRSNRRGRGQLRYESLECRDLLAGDLLLMGSPLQNPLIPLDTNDDSVVSPIDALIVLNQIALATGEGEDGPPSPAGTYPDVNGDQSITGADAQIVIDYLTRTSSANPPTPGATCADVAVPTVTIDSLPADVNEMQVFTVSGTMPNAQGVQVDMGANWQTLDFVSNAATFTWSTTGFYSDDDATGTPSDSRSVVVHARNICHSASASASLVVHNVDPAISLSAPAATDEGSEVYVVLTFGDATNMAYFGGAYSADTWTIVVDWGDGSSSTLSSLGGGYDGTYLSSQSITATHIYVDDDPTSTPQDSYSITAAIVDDDTGTGTAMASITVNNVAPSVTIDSITAIDKVLASDEEGNPIQWLNPGQLDESEGFTVRGTVSDPGVADSHTAILTIDLNFDGDMDDDGESVSVALTVDPQVPGHWTFEHTIREVLDDGRSNLPWPSNNTPSDDLFIGIEVVDDDTGTSAAYDAILVHNVSPSLEELGIVVENDEEDVPVSVTVEGFYQDAGTLDEHEVTVTWADGYSASGLVANGYYSISRALQDNPSTPLADLFPAHVRLKDDDAGQAVAVALLATTSGNYNIDIKVAAFIPLSKGVSVSWDAPPGEPYETLHWAPEPVKWGSGAMYWYFATDNRENPGDDGTSRLGSIGTVNTADIGAFAQLPGDIFSTNAGSSHRVRTIETSEVNAFTNTIQDATATASQTENRIDGPTGKSAVVIAAAAAYPFSILAPNINYDLGFTFGRLANGSTRINFAGWHDAFPAYEIVINGDVVYSYVSPDPGPTLINLGGFKTENAAGSIVVLPPTYIRGA